ncbi:MAG: transglutaminase family protein [Candidatus Fimimorpha sp.]
MFSSIDFSGCDTNWKKSMRIMEKVYQTLSYVKGATTVETSAEQALQLGQGVCQDYAHIMISLCRMAGIPSRYVVGMLIGEGLSHAWVEIESNGYWYGLDLTNFLVVNDQHIKISMGEIIKIV